ncbi:hypothetical protein GCM10022198_18150 [Klugiella xanthotipulae]|uniref:Subtilase family protein n=1 Tax=Klugiella xanthotipulae TaxID=244735 RepID=A0A543HRR2_9MICO|nr:S8 family serine peptidase [Klugiella xanthotipulae]TQM61018.1 subtilase family protein [Klugiella xanthotipulae]
MVAAGSGSAPVLRGWLRAVALCLAVAACSAGQTMPAAADDSRAGLWYFDDFGVADAHRDGHRGQGIRVAVLDSPINADAPGLGGADLRVHPEGYCDEPDSPGTRMSAVSTSSVAQHGTTMALLLAGDGTVGAGIAGVAPEATVLYYPVSYRYPDLTAWGEDDILCYRDGTLETENLAYIAEALDQAVADGARIISISLALYSTPEVIAAVTRAERAGVIVVAGLGNEINEAAGLESLNGVVVVQAMNSVGALQESNPYADESPDVVGPGLDVRGIDSDWTSPALGSGTSNATAIVSGFLAVLASAYPEATGSQLIQSLVRHATPGDPPSGAVSADRWGHGVVSLTGMLSEDPGRYPEVNPLISFAEGARPSAAQLGAAADSSATPEAAAFTPETTDSPGGTAGLILAAAAGVVAAALVGGAAYILIRYRRRGGTRGAQ